MATEPRPDLRVLFAEDNADDVAIIVRELERAGWNVTWERIETADAMRAALARTEWDLVLSDFSMPTFSAPAALALLQESGLDLPFIIVSGTIGEDVAVESLKAGAEDFLVKGRLVRLVPAIERGLREAADRRERRRAEEEVHSRDGMLQQSQKMEGLGRLAGGVAHDFNNILTVIRGSAELLSEDAADPVRKDLLEIVRAADRGAAITRQLLAFTRRQPAHRVVIDLRAAVESTRPLLERLARDTLTLGIHLPRGRVWVEADAAQMQQVLMNLVINASDAMPHGGTVTVTLREGAPGEVWIEVQDSGTGISPEVLARMFDPFFTTKPEGQGTGLGLAIVASIAEQHEGSVEVESQEGAGTRIRVRLPRAPAPPAASPKDGAPAPERELRGTFVLLVEDDERVRRFAARVLRGAGCEVVEAANASEAIARADRPRPFDLLFSDVVLPGAPGTELGRRLFERGQVAAILLTSGYPPEAPVGSLPFLAKPFTGAELLDAVAAALAE